MNTLTFVLAGCVASGDLDVVFPAESDALGTPGTPVIVHADADLLAGEWSLEVDGEERTDPLGVARAAYGGDVVEDGTDWIAWLDLDDLAAGDHAITVRAKGEAGRFRGERTFQVERGAHRVAITVVDEGGAPVTARVLALRDGEPGLGWPSTIDQRDRDQGHSQFAVDGELLLHVDPGEWRFVAVRGIRDGLGDATVDVDGDIDVDLVVPRLIPFEGLTGDLHVHTARSSDAFVPDRLRVASLAAAGVDVVAIADHNEVSSLGDRAVGFAAIDAIEANVHSGNEGHLIGFPMTSAPEPQGDDVAGWIDALRASGAEVVQLAHPRGIQFAPDGPMERVHDLFHESGYDPGLPLDAEPNAWLLVENANGTRPLDLDAIELLNRFSVAAWVEVRADWFSLLNQGVFLTGTGNSDSHAADFERAGLPMNFVSCDPCDAQGFAAAVREGRVMASTGPVLSLVVSGATPGDLVSTASPVATVTILAAPWVPVQEVRLIVDGVVVRREIVPDRRDARGVLSAAFSWSVKVESDAWVLAEAGIPELATAPRPGGDYGVVAPEYAPVAFTNPVRVDVDGDGRWR